MSEIRSRFYCIIGCSSSGPPYEPEPDRVMAQAFICRPLNCGVSLTIPGLTMWDLWWTKWHWDRLFSEYLHLYLSV